MGRKSLILLLLLFGLLVFEIIVFAPKEIGLDGRSDSKLNNNSLDEIGDQTKKIVQGIHVVEAKGSSIDWELWADRADQTSTQSLWQLEEVKSKFYGVQRVEYTVTGKTGEVSEDQKKMKVQGKVLTQSTSGFSFESDEIVYNSGAKQLESPDSIKMRGPKDKNGDRLLLTGKDLVADLKTNTISIGRDVVAQKIVKKDQIVKIRSKRARFNNEKKTARFIGNVVIDYDSMRITGPRAEFKYRKGSDLIESMVVEGGTRVTDLDKWATSDKLSVFFDDERYVLQGKPRVVQNNDELRGDKIIFLDGGKKVRVENARAKFEPEEE